MADTSRRTFVSGLVAGLPTLAYAGAQVPQAGADPVWSQIMGELQRIYGELQADSSRRDSLRAFESTLRMHAAYSMSLGNGTTIQRGVSARLRRDKREFLEQVQRMSSREHRATEMRRLWPNFEDRLPARPDPSFDDLERAAAELSRRGHIPVLIATADLVRSLAEQRPQIVRVGAGAGRQWDICQNMEAQIAALAFLTGFVCALMFVNPALGPECAALGATLATMEIAYFIFCLWF